MAESQAYREPFKVGKLKVMRLESGRLVFFSGTIDHAMKGFRALQRWMAYADKLVTDPADEPLLNEDDMERLAWMLDDVRSWLAVWDKHLEERHKRRTTEERIEALRRIAGRTPAEASAYLQKADELERRLGEKG